MTTLNPIKMIQEDADSVLRGLINSYCEALEKELNSHVIFYMGPLMSPTDDLLKDKIEALKIKYNNLSFVLETDGGYIDVTKRIAEVLRHHFNGTVDFIVPNHAMSAGTILVMSGNKIYMDYYSVLGPIDPQVPSDNEKKLIPALGYLEQYKRLIKKSEKGDLTTAEMAYLIEKFDPAELYKYEQEKELSISLLKEWLVKYKFKNWIKTETKKQNVTNKMKTERAESIAEMLNDTEKWHSHGIGISMEVLRRDVKLKIEDYEASKKLNEKIKCYYKLLKDFAEKHGHTIVFHVNEEYDGYSI
ncbi:serine dehydrogenasease [Candidatus Gottesmanbacteria bacterium]|nr:serine dehydrogenasease [Candidatus Gottesmanbacteria bacterium]